MPIWFLVVETESTIHRIDVGKEEAQAKKVLAEERDKIGMFTTVTVADRLSLPGATIKSMRLDKEEPLI